MKKLKFNIPKASGIELAAKMDMPEAGEPDNYGIFAHCFTCGKDLKLIKYISGVLAESRISLLRFDFTGLGESGGNFADTTFEGAVGDIIEAAGYLDKNFGQPSFLVGHSMGGPLVLAAAGRLDSVKAVVLIASTDNLAAFGERLLTKKAAPMADGSYSVNVSGRKFNLKKGFFDSMMNTDIPSLVKSLGKPVMIIHASGDSTVGVTAANTIFENAGYPKALVITASSEHLFNDRKEAEHLGRLINSWLTAYI